MLLIGTDEGIYRWTGGNNWPVFHGLQDRAVAAIASPGAGLLAALDTQGHVWESGNNGQGWREARLPEGAGRASALAVGGTPASILVPTRGPTLYRRMLGASSRGGSPLERARQAAPELLHRARSLVAARGGRAAVAAPPRPPDSNGWTRLGAPKPPSAAAEVTAIAATPGAWFVAMGGSGLWRSNDSGATWSPCAGLPAGVHAVRPIPGRPGGLLAATSQGVWSSADDGQTWEMRGKGMELAPHVRAVDACPGTPDYLLAGAAPAPGAAGPAVSRDGLGYGLYESRDGGKSWAKVVRCFPERLQFDAISDIRFDPSDPDRAAVAFESGELWMTLNGGDYWQPFARDIRSARVLCGVG